MKLLTVSLKQHEWNIVTAALLCLQDHDEERGATSLADETRAVRSQILFALVEQKSGVKS